MRLLPPLAAALALTACTATAPPPPPPPAAESPAAARTGCGSPVDTGPLPDWARAGFSGDPSVPHVLGDRGTITAVLFGSPLTAARTDGKANKILWVAKESYPPGDLTISAALDGTATTAGDTVEGGPGPSIVDLPRPGCWRLTLTWPGHADTLDLTYA
ncbi:hypothetical protein [Dactylosporangium sp. CA-092794]|uniref:hypothetical protein n=1 Tax=Dactylosporangium sp. CA-092794 TaxID=3239929 RepID=UPI003D8E8F98